MSIDRGQFYLAGPPGTLCGKLPRALRGWTAFRPRRKMILLSATELFHPDKCQCRHLDACQCKCPHSMIPNRP